MSEVVLRSMLSRVMVSRFAKEGSDASAADAAGACSMEGVAGEGVADCCDAAGVVEAYRIAPIDITLAPVVVGHCLGMGLRHCIRLEADESWSNAVSTGDIQSGSTGRPAYIPTLRLIDSWSAAWGELPSSAGHHLADVCLGMSQAQTSTYFGTRGCSRFAANMWDARHVRAMSDRYHHCFRSTLQLLVTILQRSTRRCDISMSRMSMRAFLSRAKKTLSQSLEGRGNTTTSFVIGNESADLDSMTCALVYAYLQSSTPTARKADKYLIPITNIPRSDLRLRPELTSLLRHADLKPADLITLDDIHSIHTALPAESVDWTLVDHNVLQGEFGKHYSERVTGVIDHHDDEGKIPQGAEPRLIEKSGSCGSLVVNYSRDVWDSISGMGSSVGAAWGQGDGAIDDIAYTSTWDAQVAKLALGSILIDTVNLKSEDKTTEHDRKAVKYLEAKINASPKMSPSYDRDAFFTEANDAKSDLDDMSLEDILRKDYKQWTEGDLTLGIASVVRPIKYLQTKSKGQKTHFLDDVYAFAKDRDLKLFAVMTSHNDSGSFERQLLLIALTEGAAVKAAETLEDKYSHELQLEPHDLGIEPGILQPPFLRMWEQKNVAASRKKVGPILRECMR